MAAIVDLTPKRELINPNFDHYQLSLDSVPAYESALDKNLDIAKPPETSFSSHHAKLFSLHNHLFPDPWNASVVYFCDRDWNIGKVSTVKAGKPEQTSSVYKVPDAANLRLKPVRFNVSVKFPAENLAVIVDGVDSFYLLDTDKRVSQGQWKVLLNGSLSGSEDVHQLLDAVHWVDGENRRVEILTAAVEEVEGETKEKHGSPYITVISWHTLLSADGTTWSVERTRKLELSRPFEFACLDRQGASVHIAASRLPRMTEDSVKPVEHLDAWEMVGGPEPTQPLYTWTQTPSEVTIHLTIPEGLTKANLNVAIHTDRLEVSVKNGVDMIKGNLTANIEVDSSTWTLEGRRLEVTLQKVMEEMWSSVVVGDNRGELVMTEDQISAIHERLQHLTSEQWNPNPEDNSNKPFNSEQLEDCDAVDDDGIILCRLDGETHQITHKVIASNQYLFSVNLEGETQTPALCLRHDVDAFLWQAASEVRREISPWEHVGVLNAFGYVLASKQQRRFSTCSPDMSVAVIADSHRHLYIYRQKVSTLSPLRNRKTGETVSSVAKQQVVSLDCTPDTILGLYVTNTQIFITMENKVLLYILKTE